MNNAQPLVPASPIAPISDLGAPDAGRVPPLKKSITPRASAYDIYHSAQIKHYLGKEDAQSALEYMKNTGPEDEDARIHGYTVIYSWLWKKLSITDSAQVRKRVLGYVANLLGKLVSNGTLQPEELMQQIEAEVQKWYRLTMHVARENLQKRGVPIPEAYVTFASKTPENSPLRDILEKV